MSMSNVQNDNLPKIDAVNWDRVNFYTAVMTIG